LWAFSPPKKVPLDNNPKGICIGTPITDKLGVFQEFDKGHSRLERRTYYVWNDTSCISKEEWPHVRSIGMAVKERLVIHKDEAGKS